MVGIYVLAGYYVQSSFGINKMMNLRFSYNLLNIFTIHFSAIFLSVQILRGYKRKYLNSRAVLGSLAVIVLAAPFMSTFASFKQVIPYVQGFAWDYRFMKLDYMAHFGNHPWEIFSFLLKHPKVIVAIDSLYMLWFPALFFMCLWMAWSSKRRLRLQFFVTVCLTWIILGTVLATLFSSAGPCYYSMVLGDHSNPYKPLMTQLMKIHESMPLFALKNQLGLWEAYQDHIWLPFGGISAMPSLHVAIAVLMAIVGWRVNLWAGILLTEYAVVTQLGSFILGWHYAIDGYVSILLTILLWKAVGKIPFFALGDSDNQVGGQAEPA
jgi:hypothetical protein